MEKLVLGSIYNAALVIQISDTVKGTKHTFSLCVTEIDKQLAQHWVNAY